MAASRSIGGVFAELTLRDGNFRAGMKKAGAAMNRFGAAAAQAGAVAAGALAAGLAAGVKRTIDMGGAMTDLSAQTGIAIKDLMQIQQAYKDNGKSADSAGKDINKMQKSIAAASLDEGGAADPFARIGLSASRLMAMDPASQFFAISEAIKKIQNPTEKTAAAMEIFGRSGGQLLAVFEGSDLESVNTSLGKMPEIMQEFSAELDHAGDLLGRLPNKSDQFFAGFTSGIINQLIPSLETVDNFDFTNIGQSLGESIGGAIEHAAFLANVLFDTLYDHFSKLENIVIPFSVFKIPSSLYDNIDKYAAAQRLIDEEQEQAAAERKKLAEEQKAYDAARRQEHMTAPDYVDPYEAARLFEHQNAPDFVEKVKSAEKSANPIDIMGARDQSMGQGSDEYLRRGLSLGETSGEKIQKKQEMYLKSILDVLKKASSNGTLVWT
jgi:hypothetical protein